MKFQASQKGLSIEYLAPSELPEIKADKARVEQILVNLVRNAIKYTTKGKVEISAETKGKELLITVADTGVGISAEEIENLFH